MTVRLSLNFGRGRDRGLGCHEEDPLTVTPSNTDALSSSSSSSHRSNQRHPCSLGSGSGGGIGGILGGKGGTRAHHTEPQHDMPRELLPPPIPPPQQHGDTKQAAAADDTNTDAPSTDDSNDGENLDPQERRIADLEDELRRLRESTKMALQHSWDENEAVSRRARAAETSAAKLGRKLDKTKKREEHWRTKCDGLWHRLMNESGGQLDFNLNDGAPEEHNSDEEEQEAPARPNPANRHTFLGSLRKTSIDMIRGGGGHHNGGGAPDPQQQAAMAAVASQLRESQKRAEEQSELVAQQLAQFGELESKLSSRDAIIGTLEQTAKAQSRALEALRRQLEGMKNDGMEREANMGEEIVELRKRVQKKRVVIKDQCRKFSEAQNYIEEVTTELQRVFEIEKTSCVSSKGGAPPQQQQSVGLPILGAKQAPG